MIGINSALLNLPLPFFTSSLTKSCPSFPSSSHSPSAADPLLPRSFRPLVKSAETATTMEAAAQKTTSESDLPMKLLFVEMGVGYDQHGQDITVAAMRACRDAISSNSIPAFRRGSIPGVSFEQMKLQIKLGVPHSLQQALDIEKVKSVFPY